MDMNWSWSDINYWAVIVSTVASVAIGYVWYMLLFKKVWMRMDGVTEKDIRDRRLTPLVVLVLWFGINQVIAILLKMNNAADLEKGIWTGVAAIILVACSQGIYFYTNNKSLSSYLLGMCNAAISILVATVILCSWQ